MPDEKPEDRFTSPMTLTIGDEVVYDPYAKDETEEQELPASEQLKRFVARKRKQTQ